MQTATYIKVFLICFIIGLTHRASAIITIDSAVTTPSRCANDGTITVYGHSGTSMIYAIVSGPDIRVPQSGNQFGGLPQGSYQVMITNFSNDTALIPAVVGGNYTFPDFAPTYADPFCAGTASGMIIGNALSTAKPPFTWILTNLTTNVTTTQASDSFLNLPAGSYSLRLLDSCQSFATRSVTLIDPNHSFTIGNINNELYSCDTVQVYIQLYIPGGNYAAPYTIQIQTHNGTYQHVINNFMAGGWYPEFRERVGGVTYGDYINITITDACGYSQYKQDVVAPFNVQVNFAGRTDTCQAAFAAYFAVAGYTGQQNVWPTFMNSPVTIVVSDPTTGVRIDSSMTYGDTIRGSVFLAYTPFLVSGHIYHISMTDGCGNNFSHDYQWPVIAPPTITQYPSPYSCYDSTGAYDIIWYNRFYTIPTFELLSGPTSIHSSKPHYTYQDTITYPQSYLCSLGGNNGTGAFAHAISLSNLGVGTYHYRVYDSCGNSFTDSFTIRPQDVSDYRYTFSFTRGCPGENVANISFNNVNYMASALLLSPNGTLVANLFNPPNTVRNLNAGTYVLSLTYYRSFTIPVNQNLNCWVMNDTIVIPPYALPQIAYATQVKCNGTVNVGLQPDSSKGIPPYKYEILSGPQTAAIQPSNFFTLTQPGTYVARISDTCGFAQTFTFTVDTLSFPQIVKVGSSCPGNSAMLITQHSAYATYTWQRPNGTFYTGDTLHLNPVLPTDYGVYHIVKYVSVNGCRDTFSTTYTLTSGGITDNFATICAGQSIVFAGHTYTQAGVYYDTIHTILCDSITILHLSIGGFVRDSVSVSICSGQTVTVGTHVYNTSGIYRDTFATTGCDSIHILNLQVGGVKRDSVSQSICSGQSITVGTHIYNTSGVYRDTFTTAGCDSVHILNLQVGSVRRDSVSQSICSGQSITVGTHIYNTSGIYRDTFATTGCDSIHILNLQVGGVKRDSVSQNICSGQSVTVGTHIYNTSGIYRDTFATTGCDSIHILNLQIGGMKRDSVSQNICSGQSITVGTHIYNASGIYRDTFATAGCDSVHILNLQVGGAKYDSASRSICPGQTVMVGAHTYGTAGIYRDTLSTTSGCDSIFVLNLTIGGVKRDTIGISLCAGESVSIGGVTYTQAGVYSDTIATGGCDSIHSIRVSVSARPDLQIIASGTTVSQGDTVQLNASSSSSLSYHWTSTAVLNGPNRPDPTMIVNQSSWVIALGVDANNCTAIDSIFIKVGDCEGAVFVPNAFTPNGDGINDKYRIFGRCIRLNSLKIFNRWGEKVWETEDINQTWDGSYRGAQQPTEVYVYIVNYSLLSDKNGIAKQMQGSITLIR